MYGSRSGIHCADRWRRGILWLTAALALLTAIGRTAYDTGVAAFAQNAAQADDGMKRDLLALMLAYPDACRAQAKAATGGYTS